MTAQEILLNEAAKRIAEALHQRDKARRDLSTARSIIREFMRAFVSDMEADEEDYPTSVRQKAFVRAERFLDKGKRK